MNASHWHLPFGANLIAANRTQFRIWAPAQTALSVAIEGGPSLAMARHDAGWFTVEADCGVGTRYRYVFADGTQVPDPAARAQSGDIQVQASLLIHARIAGVTEIGEADPGETQSSMNFTSDCLAGSRA